MVTRNLSHFFRNHSIKALGEVRGSQLVFKDLCDSYNETILDSNVNEEIKDILMGHLRESAKASYSLSIASVVRIYREEIFPKLAVNGWRLEQKASKVDQLMVEVENLRSALNNVENENIAYKTRVDNLQAHMVKLEDKSLKTEQEIEALKLRNEDLGEAVDFLSASFRSERLMDDPDFSECYRSSEPPLCFASW